MAATALFKSVNGGGSVCPEGELKSKWTNWMCIRAANRTPAGGGKSAVSHTRMWTHILHTHTERHLNRDEPISRRQTWAQQIDGGRKKEWATWKNTLKHSVCRQRPERKVQRRHLHTRTLSGKLRWPEEDPSWHSGGIMWQSVWSEWGRHSDIIHTEEEK